MDHQRVRLGMVGGGEGSLIGEIHRIAARLDDRFELVCGCFSRNASSNTATGRRLGISPDRVYQNYQHMVDAESGRPFSDRMECVAIVTPNNSHVPIAEAFLRSGFHVICDKPLGVSVAEAEAIERLVDERQRVFVMTYNYSANPMIREARRIFAGGEAGVLRKVVVEYLQDGLARPVERDGNRQAVWRTDPEQSGPGGTITDIGTHAAHLVEFVTGERIQQVCADLTSFLGGRALDDDANVLLRLTGGAKGVMSVSQIAVGEESGFSLRAYGDRASVSWRQENPNYLNVGFYGAAPTRLSRGARYTTPTAGLRTPAGHPEGFLEDFATIYAETADLIRRDHGATASVGDARPTPGVRDGVRGVRFVEAVIESSARGGQWVLVE